MRIALFSGNYNYIKEGANQALNQLVRYLEAERGATVRVYSPVTDTPAFEPAGMLVPVPSVALPMRGEFRFALGLPPRIRRDVEAFAPDLIHVSSPDLLGMRAQSLAKRLGVPVVASLHTRFETYLGHYGLGWARPALEAHLRRFYRRSDHVLAPTRAIADEIRSLRGDDRVTLWSRGVDRTLFDPARRDEAWRLQQGIAPDEIAILFFGRLVLEKGVDDYVAALRELQARGERVRPLVVGAGPAADRFRALPGAILTGHLQDAPLARAIASADILLNPSRSEAFGNVVLEAMASGLAIVSADAQSACELIVDGKSGLLCRDDYAASVQSLIGAPDRRQTLGREARRASESYSWSAASGSAARAYDEVLTEAAHAVRRQPGQAAASGPH